MSTDDALTAATARAIKTAHEPDTDIYRPEWSDNWLVFLLCREFASVDSATPFGTKYLEPYVLAYWNACKDTDVPSDWEECWEQFLDIWDHQKMMMPTGNPLPIAIARAKRAKDQKQWADLGGPELRLLARICWELAKMHLDGVFFLSQKDAAIALGVTQPRAGRMFHRLVREGIIYEKDRAPQGTIKAIRYKFFKVA